MATVQEPRADRAEAFVGGQIDRARRRIQAQDVGVAVLGLVAGTLAYTLGMVLLDRWLNLSDAARQVALFGYVAAAAAYVGLIVTRPFRREVNPYFAARRVERAVPGAKNSVVSWLDLHDEPLPASIKSAVSQKAAADLQRADLDEVVRDRRMSWLGGTAGGLFVAALILFFLLRPNQFLSLLGRAFAPFGSGSIASQTTIDLLQPAGGDVTVPVNTPVDFRVAVSGRVPDPTAADAVRLRLRYNPADPSWEEIPLAPSLRDAREFAVRVPSNRVQTGFVYRVVGGDAATPEHRVSVRSSPLIEGVEAVYRFRPYLRFRDHTATNANIEALRGTTVTLTVRTNRTVRDGTLTFYPVRDGQTLPPPLSAAAVPDQAAAMRFQFVLDQDAKYTIRFHSAEGEDNGEPIPYTIKVLSDHAPQVDVTRPAPDTLPVNGAITVEGRASDDFGITAMRLCLRLPGEPPTDLDPKPYRKGKSFKFDDGTFPRTLEYKDFLPLDQVKTTIGAAVPLRPGMVIEYWLEADDNCDHPKANVGKSKVFRVTLAEEQPPEDKQAGDQKAAGDKAEHDQKQDKDLADENQQKKEKGDQGQPDGDPQPGEKPDANPQGEPKAGDNPAEDAGQKEMERKLQDAQKALAKEQQRNREQGKGDGKDNPPPQAGEQPMNPGEPKDEQGNKSDGNPQGAQQNNQPKQPSGEPKGDPKGEPKSAQPQAGSEKGEGKPDGQPDAQPDPGAAKDMTAKPQANGGGNSPKPSSQPNAGNPNQLDEKNRTPQQPNGQGESQANPNGPGNAAQPEKKQPPSPDEKPGQPDSKQPNGTAGDQPGQPKGQQPNPGEAKPQPQDGQPNAGEKKDQPQGGAQPGEAKDGPGSNTGGGQKTGASNDQTNKPPATGGTPGNSQQAKPGQPNASPPNQGENSPTNSKPSDGNRPPSDNSKKPSDGNNSPPKEGADADSQPGQKGQPGDEPGNGPKKDPSNSDPKGQPPANDPGRDGQGGTKGSGKPDAGKPPNGAKPEDATNGQGQDGRPDAGDAKPRPAQSKGTDKGEGKPAGEATDDGPGRPEGQARHGQLQDAPKPHDQPGASTKTQPNSDGTPSAKDQAPERDPKGGTGQAAPRQPKADPQRPGDGPDGKWELGKLADDLKSGDPKRQKAAEERLKELMKQAGNDPKARQAIEEAMKRAGEANASGAKSGGDKPDPSGANPKRDGETGDKPGDAHGEPRNQSAKPGTGNQPGPGEAAKKPGEPTAKNDGPGQPGERSNPPGGDRPPTAPGDGTPPTDEGTPTNRRDGTGVPGANPPAAPDTSPVPPTPPGTGLAPNAEFAKKSGDLQLEKFPKNPSRELLKDLGMTEEQYRQFLKDAAELQKKRDAEAKNNRERGGRTGTSAANTGAKRVGANGEKKEALERGGATPPPSEYKDGYKGYTEDVSKPSGGAKKE